MTVGEIYMYLCFDVFYSMKERKQVQCSEIIFITATLFLIKKHIKIRQSQIAIISDRKPSKLSVESEI